MHRGPFALGLLLLVLSTAACARADGSPGLTDEQILKKAGVAPEGAALQGYLRAQAAKDARAADPAVTAAAIRLLARLKPAGAAEVLLAYLPFSADALVTEEVERALTTLAFRDGQPEQALVRAQADPAAPRRITAGLALCRASRGRPVPEVRRLLRDPDALVRLRIAAALAEQNDEEAVPVLIALLVDLPADQAWQAEEALSRLASGLAPTVTLKPEEAGKPAGFRAYHDAWEKWWRTHDGATLLQLFRKWTPQEGDQQRILAQIRQLGDDDFAVREQASATLIQWGGAALPWLRQAVRDPDVEISYRSRRCLQEIEKGSALVLPIGVARLLALRKPPGAAEVLLAYLPVAEDAGADEIQDALAAVAFRDGKADPVVLQALDDKTPLRRAAAAVALCRGGGPSDAAEARRFLKDPEAEVRLRVALALADRGDKQVVPVLIDLLKELPSGQVWQAEEVLRQIAGETAPKEVLRPLAGTDKTAAPDPNRDPERLKCHVAWMAWWRDHAARLDLAGLERRPHVLGYTLISEWTEGRQGQVGELGFNRKTRWQLEKMPWSLDTQLLPGNRLLLAEFYEERVAERTLKGELVWEKKVSQRPLTVQRLPSGNTFIATANQLLEVDRGGKEVVNVSRNGVWAAKRLRDGRIACITAPGKFALLDATGKELKSFVVENYQNYCGFDVLPGGGILVPRTTANEVVEYDADGHLVGRLSVERPTGVERLPGGNTLVACRDAQQVVELDPAGKVVWQYKTTGFPWRAHRR
jgi:HEAT repeat protein